MIGVSFANLFIFATQMKKLAASILLLVYFTVTTGFVVSVHYCMNKVDSIQLGDTSSESCGKCGMHIEDSDGCCKNDVKVVKMSVDQSYAKITVPDFTLSLPLPSFQEVHRFSLLASLQKDYPLAHGPPISEQDTYLQNCVFRL